MDAAPLPERSASMRELAIALARGWPHESRRPAGLPAWAHNVRVAAPVEQQRRSFTSAGRFEGVVPGVDVGWLLESERTWSPSRLESYRTCSFQFFGGYALGLRELDEQQEQADAATRGTVMHAMLEEAIEPLAQRGAGLDTTTAAEVVDRLRTLGRATWDRAPEEHAFGRAALWRYEGDLALDQLASMVWREARLNEAIGVTAVVGGEQEFTSTLPGIDPPMLISGRSDRVDRGPGLIQIVDYKTGRPIEEREVTSGRRLQLQLYALAARAQFGDVRLVARYAFLRPPQHEWSLDSSNAEHQLILADAAEIAASVRSEVRAGAFQVSPQVTPCPSYCSFQHVCRVNSFSRYKTWN
jgi:RecB family exonuclease